MPCSHIHRLFHLFIFRYVLIRNFFLFFCISSPGYEYFMGLVLLFQQDTKTSHTHKPNLAYCKACCWSLQYFALHYLYARHIPYLSSFNTPICSFKNVQTYTQHIQRLWMKKKMCAAAKRFFFPFYLFVVCSFVFFFYKRAILTVK